MDYHTATAAKMFNVPYDQVTPLQRAKAKEANFYTTYGTFGNLDEFAVTTPFGRKRSDRSPQRQAANYLIQGMAPEPTRFVVDHEGVLRREHVLDAE